jgi:hypothetical protein
MYYCTRCDTRTIFSSAIRVTSIRDYCDDLGEDK